jgi:transposase
MSRTATPVVLSDEEREGLQKLIRAGTTPQQISRRARLILMAAEGVGTLEIARRLAMAPDAVSKWRKRYASTRSLSDLPRSGAPPKYDAHVERRILKALDAPPPAGYSQWDGPRLAQALGDVSVDHIWRVLRKHNISLARRKSWCISTDPEFAPKAADVVGIYMNPPENAVVLAVDEKPSIQALERAQGYLRLPNGKAISGYSHEYKRHGTTTLFAALEIATGQVIAGHYNRRRRVEFLDFMNRVVAAYPGKEIHVVLDNLSTHKPKRDHWLARHKNVHFHYTPTHASWLNLCECWFSILSRRALRGASFTSPRQLREAIDRFIEAYHQECGPFEWTKRDVHPVGLKRYMSELCR